MKACARDCMKNKTHAQTHLLRLACQRCLQPLNLVLGQHCHCSLHALIWHRVQSRLLTAKQLPLQLGALALHGAHRWRPWCQPVQCQQIGSWWQEGGSIVGEVQQLQAELNICCQGRRLQCRCRMVLDGQVALLQQVSCLQE